jgi:hypothetical protein
LQIESKVDDGHSVWVKICEVLVWSDDSPFKLTFEFIKGNEKMFFVAIFFIFFILQKMYGFFYILDELGLSSNQLKIWE